MKKALIIGLDDYPGRPLAGCVRDAQMLSQVLSHHDDGQADFECEVITAPSQVVTRAFLRERISELFQHPADVALLHFSGHGTVNRLGGYLITPDYSEHDLGIPMSDILTLASQSPATDKFITLDCCDSGAFGLLAVIGSERTALAEGVSVITATRSGQEALEEGGRGVFTSLLTEALKGGAADLHGGITTASVYAYIENALGSGDQQPMFKANVSRFVCLRKAKPRLPNELIRKLKIYFPLPAELLQLSPVYEPSSSSPDSVKVKIFRDLQRLRDAGLIHPVDTEHMYYAAMESKACGLTTLGKYYWRLVNENKI